MGAGASSQYRAGDANHRPPSFAEAVATKRRTTPNINVVVDGMNVALANVPEASTSQALPTAPTMAPPVMEQKEEGPLDLTRFDSAEALEAVGLERLKAELTAQKLKCGGTLRERAARLFLLRDNTRDEIDKKHWSK